MNQNTFTLGSTVHVRNRMQPFYSYVLTAERGVLEPGFNPVFTPNEMLRLGVFEGKYMTDCGDEYPEEMFLGARFSIYKPDVKCNAFLAKSRNGLVEWRTRGWIHAQDPRGWFEWYCRYWLGRRTADDARQIRRWARFAPRHAGALMHFGYGNIATRAKTRQALLQWSHDPVPELTPAQAGCVGRTVLAKVKYLLQQRK